MQQPFATDGRIYNKLEEAGAVEEAGGRKDRVRQGYRKVGRARSSAPAWLRLRGCVL